MRKRLFAFPRKLITLLITGRRSPQHLHRLLDREGTGSLAWRKLYKARQMLPHDTLRRDDHERMLNETSARNRRTRAAPVRTDRSAD
jgi:hypothetical protein